jgi:2'-5' RNA ligase
MRIFVALDIEESIRERIARFLDGVRAFAPDARWVRPESLHVTLKFVGEKPNEEVERVKQALASVRAKPVSMTFGGYGFFPTAKSARVFWLGLEAGPELADLASTVDQSTAAAGVPTEERPFSPHLTLARGGGGSGAPARLKGDRPNRVFQVLQDKLAALPAVEFGTMTAREFFLFQSQLGRGGSRYTKIAAYPLEAGH